MESSDEKFFDELYDLLDEAADPARRITTFEKIKEWLLSTREKAKLEDVMTAAEVSEEYGLARNVPTNYVDRGYLPARKAGKTVLILREDAEKRWGSRRKT